MDLLANQHHSVTVLILDGALPMDVGIPLQVFTERTGFPYVVTICGESPGHIALSSGLEVAVSEGIEALEAADTVIVPGYVSPTRAVTGSVVEALANAHARGARIISICYGAFALAQAGLLSGRRATTHWDAAGELARRYPATHVDPNVLFIDEETVLTSAGVSAGLDLCLHVVRKDLGAKAANEISRRLVAPPRRPGGQAQYMPLILPTTEGDTLEAVRTWIQENLHESLTTAQLAKHAALSIRTFERRFLKETGTTPHRWILHARLEAARALIEDSAHSIERIAVQTGFGTSANFRQHFRHVLHTSPSAYRRAFTTRLRDL